MIQTKHGTEILSIDGVFFRPKINKRGTEVDVTFENGTAQILVHAIKDTPEVREALARVGVDYEECVRNNNGTR